MSVVESIPKSSLDALIRARERNARAVTLSLAICCWLLLPMLLIVPMRAERELILIPVMATGIVSPLAYLMTRRGYYLWPVLVSIASSLLQHIAISLAPEASAVIPFIAPVYLLIAALCLNLSWLPLVYGVSVLTILVEWYLGAGMASPPLTDPGTYLGALTLLTFTAAIVWIGVRGFERAIMIAQAEQSHRQALLLKLEKGARMESLGRLAAGVAHDFNNFLMVIRASTEIAEAQLNAPQVLARELQQIQAAADRAAELTRQLLRFGRPQQDHPNSIAMSDLMDELEPMMRKVVGNEIEFIVDIQGEIGSVMANRTELEQIFLNLVSNGRDAMPKGGCLSVSASKVRLEAGQVRELPSGGYLEFRVKDTGTGISPDVLGHIFEPFFTTKGQGKGTGLGLATSFAIAERLSGTIAVHSQKGQGATFSVYLPQDVGEEQEDSAL